MKRLIAGFLLVLAACGAAVAATPLGDGYMLMHGTVRQPDGTMKRFSDVWVHYTIARVKAVPLSPLPGFPTQDQPRPVSSPRPQPRTIQTVYMADAGEPYGIIDPDQGTGASCLDDIQMLSSGTGKVWQNLTWGFSNPNGTDFYYRWFIYDTFTPGHGPGISAYSGIQFDGGGPFPGSFYGPGTYNLTVNLPASFVSIVCDSPNIFFGQWFQSQQNPNTGDGPFDQSMSAVFNQNADVNAGFGSSANTFYFDGDLNGIWDDQEVDYFADPAPPFANFLLGITINSSLITNQIQPNNLILLIGKYISGDYTDTQLLDQSYYIAGPSSGNSISLISHPPHPSPVKPNPVYPIVIREEIDGKAGSTAANSFDFLLVAGATQDGGTLRVSFWNWQTSAWDLRQSYTMATTDASYDFSSTNSPSKYISQDANRKMRSLVEYIPAGQLPSTYQLRIDQAKWTITHP